MIERPELEQDHDLMTTAVRDVSQVQVLINLSSGQLIKKITMKSVDIKLGYYPSGGGVTGKQLGYIQRLLEKDYGDAYHHYITKYGTRNPFNRLNQANARKLIDGLLKKEKIVFIDKA